METKLNIAIEEFKVITDAIADIRKNQNKYCPLLIPVYTLRRDNSTCKIVYTSTKQSKTVKTTLICICNDYPVAVFWLTPDVTDIQINDWISKALGESILFLSK